MTTFVALLRGINVGGRNLVSMADLQKFLESQQLTGVRTLLQSGNALFQSPSGNAAALEKKLEQAAAKALPRPLEFFLRKASEWESICAANPYTREAAEAPGYLLVMFLKDIPSSAALASLQAALNGPEYFQLHHRELYIVYPEGAGRSRFTSALIERKLNTRGTARNWNTLSKIAALMGHT